jgi:predicted choloylglycine hydrolase
MPELVGVRERLAAELDRPDGDSFLTFANMRTSFAGCTQIGGAGRLLRNDDFAPGRCEGTIVRSRFLRPVIGTQEGGWGLLDGMNDAGLAISLTFGGRSARGPGFAVPLVLRYLLETCATVAEAVARLRTIPLSTAQNLTLADRGRAVTVYAGPDIPLTGAPDACAANHQLAPVPEGQERFTGERLARVRATGADVAAMLRPPLYMTAYDEGLGTLYTADYRPAEGRVVHHWPGERWEQSFDRFTPGSRTVVLGAVG